MADRLIADIHTHSRFAGACSESLTIKNMNSTALTKGIDVIGTGDFTHPKWLAEIKEELEGDSGIYSLKDGKSASFVFSTEVCTIFTHGSGLKKIHHCIIASDVSAAESINDSISKMGNLSSDGRPILSTSPAEMVEAVMGADRKAIIFPAHAWTPWYGVFGTYGFNSIKEAYGDQAKHIKAIETGLSSNPEMNWRVSKLDGYALFSGSDAHSLPKLGREVIVMNREGSLTYDKFASQLLGRRFAMTVEFYPEEGKYHYDGHRKCNVSLSPEAARKFNGICPVCRKRLTVGVLHRIEELADRKPGEKPSGAIPFISAVPLQEVISNASGKSPGSEYVKKAYAGLVAAFGTEFGVFLDAGTEEIRRIDPKLGEAMDNMRNGKINITPGYDGVFGVVDLLNKMPAQKKGGQKSISDF